LLLCGSTQIGELGAAFEPARGAEGVSDGREETPLRNKSCRGVIETESEHRACDGSPLGGRRRCFYKKAEKRGEKLVGELLPTSGGASSSDNVVQT